MGKPLVVAVCGALALGCAGIGTASAEVVYTGSIASQDATLYAAPGLSVTIPEFDPLVNGTLTGIEITVSSFSVANLSVINLGTVPNTFKNASATTTIALSGPLGYSGTLTTVSTLANGMVPAAMTITNPAPPPATFLDPGISDFPAVAGSNVSTISVPTADFGNFEGTGTFALTFVNGEGNAVISGTTSGVLSDTLYFGGGDALALNVVVDFQTVPEPTSLVLIGMGLIGLGVARARRRG